MNLLAFVTLLLPPGVVTLTETVPETPGAVAIISVPDTTVKPFAALEPNDTELVQSRPVPLMTTFVPLAPLFGDSDVMVGTGSAPRYRDSPIPIGVSEPARHVVALRRRVEAAAGRRVVVVPDPDVVDDRLVLGGELVQRGVQETEPVQLALLHIQQSGHGRPQRCGGARPADALPLALLEDDVAVGRIG